MGGKRANPLTEFRKKVIKVNFNHPIVGGLLGHIRNTDYTGASVCTDLLCGGALFPVGGCGGCDVTYRGGRV